MALNQTIVSLNLDYCEIGRDGAEAIGRGIATNTSLTEIFLNGNTVGASGAMLMAQGLRHNGTLTRLELRDNQIDQYATNAALPAPPHPSAVSTAREDAWQNALPVSRQPG